MTATMSVDSSGQQHFYKRKQEEKPAKDEVSHRSKKKQLRSRHESQRGAFSPEPKDKTPIEAHPESDPEEIDIPEDPTEDLEDESNKTDEEVDDEDKPEPSTKETVKSERISELESQVQTERSAREKLQKELESYKMLTKELLSEVRDKK